MNKLTLEDIELTLEWIVKAKYPAILQIVLDKHDWSDKYPLLEKVIDGLLK